MSRIFVAGATGTLGRPLIKQLVAQGHQVVGMTRSPDRRGIIAGLGAEPVVADALDVDAVRRAVAHARPDTVVHLLTALPAAGVMRASELDATNRLREHGTRHLIQAALAEGVRRMVAESFMAASAESNPAQTALASLETQLSDARPTIETVALRYGGLYGSAVPSTRGMANRIRTGRMFVPGGPEGLLSFVHLDDAVAAAAAVIAAARPGPLYEVADDQPISAATFVRVLAAALGAREPRTMPRWLMRLMAPMLAEFAAARMPLSHAAITNDLGWQPAYPSVQEGTREVAAALRKAA